MTDSHASETVFETLSGAEATDSRTEARNGLRHIASLSMTKIADGLINPKLVLSWLLTALGAPAYLVGALVPIREAGALLPQVFLAGWVARMRHRKWAWVIGSAGQGIAAALIVLAALTLTGAAAGWAIAGLLALLAVSRAMASVSYKEVLGKTVRKTRRGGVTGFAASAASIGVLAFAVLLISGLAQSQGVVIGAIGLAALLWLAAAMLFSTLEELASDPDRQGGGVDWAILRDNPQLRRFILVRGLLVSTALAPPYLVLLGGGEGGQLGQLGALVLASAAASLVSSWIWGRMADRSSRRVLMLSGAVGAVAMLAALALDLAGLAGAVWAMPAVLFVLMIAYHGVRQGRSTYLVDMAPEDRRAAWSAVANTVIGSILLAVGALGGAAALLGPEVGLLLFAGLAALAPVAALGLDEVER
ncbi:MFS transporter [Mesobacterium pallidum]|uniref:MFS transporter n=1 Tax=Mesobacterium pallidum TaxID=2872037 RepID=UPI001EE35679|nr:MFS transporter [Mesobacterium pallidum]